METTIEKYRNIYTLECIDSIFYSFGIIFFQYYFGVQKRKFFVDHHGKQV
jgi:hypothetical protein